MLDVLCVLSPEHIHQIICSLFNFLELEMLKMRMSISILQMLLVLLFLIQSLGADSNASCVKSERDALLKFKDGLIDHLNRLESWVGEECCLWEGVSCSNRDGHVMKLDLRNLQGSHDWKEFEKSSLGGEINHSLLNLTRLNHLDLSMNNFSNIGIPEFLGSLKMLRYLNLSRAKFIGKVPVYMGNLSGLQYLDLSYNSELIIDSLRFVSTLTSLKSLDLSGLYLAEAVDLFNSLNFLPSLMELYLSFCYIHSFPGFLNVNFTSLAIVDLSSNKFNSTIPRWFLNISNIQHLDLSENLLQGYLPGEVLNYNFLEVLDLHGNNLEGEIPDTLMNRLCNLHELDFGWNSFIGDIGGFIGNSSDCLHSSLKTLDLANNNFRGEIGGLFGNSSDCLHSSLKTLDLRNNNFSGVLPDSLGQCKSLENLFLSHNTFEGPIPESIGGLSSLRVLYLDNNSLSGSIPGSLGQLSKLQVLDIHSNKLDSMVSEMHFSGLKSLTELQMHENSLVFDIDSSWVAPFQLESIHLSSCKLGPKFPEWLIAGTNNSLKFLDLYNTSISDGMPDWFENISSNLVWLDLSHNQITKQLPKFGKPATALLDSRLVYLNSNKFEGPFTAFPWDTEVLDISNNLLSGQIPQTIGNMMPHLRFLSLSNNYFNGTIPTSLCEMKDLTYLDLSKNQLSGALPQCWQQIESLAVLDLAYNNLSGCIPVSLGSRSNRGFGIQVNSLVSLHLEKNNFQGNIPTSLKNLKSLLTLDLSENAFTGTIPSWIGELSSLTILSLNSNMFEGEIPAQLCRLASLRILNLANNRMTGNIPHCFDNFTSMIVDDPDFVDFWLSSFAFPAIFQMPDRSNAYQDHVLTYIKGRELEYNKTIQFLFSIDVSENRFFGELPTELVNLSLVQNLNLSGNNFHGHIPSQIGSLKSLESLDLSRNELSGSIPSSISNLNFLSYLNLSFNNLSGPIPHGNQLQTLNDKSSYIGNNGLCGPPLESCQKEADLPKRRKPVGESSEDDESEMLWFYCGLGVGFMAGFVGVCTTLYWKHSWRYAWFQLIDKIYNKLWVIVAIKINQLRRKFNTDER